MKILALNSGSSSIKYRVLDSARKYQLVEQGIVQKIGENGSSLEIIRDNKTVRKEEKPFSDHREAMKALFHGNTVIQKIDAVGHRVVHGGETFKGPIVINAEVIKEIKELAKFAPLHCEPNVIGIEMLHNLLPSIPQIAVFDTTAHAAMEPKAFLYGIPIDFYEKYKIRKYGFHGINHDYVAHETARLLNKPLAELKIITCHLGNGCSLSAFKNGKSCDNSMGLTPLEGLVMGTRCGDLDPSVVLYLQKEIGLGNEEMTDLLNKKSGLLGLCGHRDMRDIIARAKNGDSRSQMAIELFVYRIQKYIGAFVAVLDGVDAITFTGGIGENSPCIRDRVMKSFSYLGARLDSDKNEKNTPIFSSHDSQVFLLTIPANEELSIAQQTYRLLADRDLDADKKTGSAGSPSAAR